MTDSTTSDTSYLLSITEMPEPDSSASMIGVCAVDTTTGRFLLSQVSIISKALTRLPFALLLMQDLNLVGNVKLF